MSERKVDASGTRTVTDKNIIAHLHVGGDLYVHGVGPLKAEDLAWLYENNLSKAFRNGKNSGNSDWDPYKQECISKVSG